MLAAAAAAAAAIIEITTVGTPSIGGPFTLVDHDGRVVTNHTFSGRFDWRGGAQSGWHGSLTVEIPSPKVHADLLWIHLLPRHLPR